MTRLQPPVERTTSTTEHMGVLPRLELVVNDHFDECSHVISSSGRHVKHFLMTRHFLLLLDERITVSRGTSDRLVSLWLYKLLFSLDRSFG